MKNIALLLNDLESKTPHKDVLNIEISKSNVAWHIDHSIKVINSVISVLKKSETNYRWNLNLKRTYFLIVKRIPRGKAKAPKFVQSFEEITIKDIERQLKTAHFLLLELETMDPKTNFTHPFIGNLNLKQALLFLEIHTKHHIKIINDIIKK
jgi:hypothetical protein